MQCKDSHTSLEAEDKADCALACAPCKQARAASAAEAESGAQAVTSLWPALWGAYGWPYLSLGLLKLFGDLLNFAGRAPGCHSPPKLTYMPSR